MKESILLVPNNIKKNVIKIVREKYYNYNIKFMSLEDFIKKYTFDYNNKTIYNLMKKYNINYDTATIYLNSLYNISDNLNNNKMSKLKEIKSYLEENKLLIFNKHFVNYIQDKPIYIYGYDYISKNYLNILNKLNYKIIEKKYQEYKIDKIFFADYIEDEVIYVANQISKLLKNNIKINNIKIIASSEYYETIKRIFKIYNIPINNKANSIYSTLECKKLLNNLNDINKVLESINNIDIKNNIITVLNNYNFIEDKEEVKELIIHDLKETELNKNKTGINIISINDEITDKDYIFLMGYNKENIPIIYKDNDYFSDQEKKILNLETSQELNRIEKKCIIKKIKNIKNLVITYKLYDSNNNYTKSDLIDNIQEEKIINKDYNHSNTINKIVLAQKLDNLVKYNIKEEDLDILSSNYNIPYMEYDNSYTQIEKNKLHEYLDNKLLLSYTAFDNYNRCKFKYYLNHILKINIIKDDYAIIIGNICHYVLSNIDKPDFDVYRYFDKYLETERVLTEREKFFLTLIKEELVFTINTIKKQLTYSTLDQKMYEEKVYINYNKTIKVTFMGIIDKVLYKEEDNITYLVVIDYKTGSADIKLDNKEFGIGLQLPIYLYLSSKMKLKNVKVIGFYLQKLLNNNLDNTKDYITAKENNLKLEGYSINNESLLSKFDNTYKDSKMIKSMKTTNNGFYTYSKVLSEEEINNLITDVDNQINKVSDEILNADFKINPKIINGDNISCKFCEYKDICFRREKDLLYINKEEKND